MSFKSFLLSSTCALLSFSVLGQVVDIVPEPTFKPLLAVAEENGDCEEGYVLTETAYDLKEGVKLLEVVCGAGAYNTVAYYGYLNYKNVFKALTFAEPTISEKNVLKGWHSVAYVGGGSFDSKTKKINFSFKGRGLGDAGSSGVYALSQNTGYEVNFSLIRYESDLTYDSKFNPKVILDTKATFKL